MHRATIAHSLIGFCLIGVSTAALSFAGAADHSAKAVLKNAQGRVLGHVQLIEGEQATIVRLRLEQAPAGVHAFHLHETGRCDPPTFESAGGHFNPAGKKHGMQNVAGPHVGDLPNVHVPASGRVTAEYFVDNAPLRDGSAALIDGDGAAVVLHAKPDDYMTDPAGAAGDRIACGVLGQE